MPSNFKALAGASGGEPTDANFKNVTLLLHGDGSNGAQNNTFLDSSTNNFTITRNGNTTQGSFSPYGSNWSNYFDGSGDYLTAASDAAFGFGTGAFTIEGWVFVTGSAASGSVIADFRTGTGTAIKPCIYFDSAYTLYYLVNGSNVINGGTIPTNSWVHVALSRSGASTKMFVNGVQVGSTYSDSNDYGASASCFIGADNDGSANAFLVGYASNVRVVKGTAVYTSTFTPSTTPLTAITNTSLLTCQSNRFRDGSTNNFTITRNGDVKVTNFAPFAPSSAYSTTTNGGSGYFDGSGDYLTASPTALSTGDFTFECWIYSTGTGQYQYFYDTRTSGNDAAGFCVIYNHASYPNKVSIYSNGFIGTPTIDIPVGAWTHYALVRSSGSWRTFVNGAADISPTSASRTLSNTALKIAAGQALDYFFNGYISNYRIVNGTAVYTGAFTPPTANLTAISGTSLLTNFTNAAIFDNSMKNDLETVGNAQISTSVKKFGTGSMAFDGTGDWLQLPSTSELSFGTGNFTIEMWMYAQNLASIPMLFHKGSSGSNGWFCQTSASTLYFGQLDSARYSTWSVSLSNNTWYHIALTRVGSTLNVFINGVSQTAQTVSGADTSNDNTSPALIGVIAGGTYALQGYLDDYRITKGVARYTANFTPPTAAFPNK